MVFGRAKITEISFIGHYFKQTQLFFGGNKFFTNQSSKTKTDTIQLDTTSYPSLSISLLLAIHFDSIYSTTTCIDSLPNLSPSVISFFIQLLDIYIYMYIEFVLGSFEVLALSAAKLLLSQPSKCGIRLLPKLPMKKLFLLSSWLLQPSFAILHSPLCFYVHPKPFKDIF